MDFFSQSVEFDVHNFLIGIIMKRLNSCYNIKWHLFVFLLTAFPLMLKINSFNLGYRFSVYVRVVAVRCGTLLQPMPMSSWCLVKKIWDVHVKQIINMFSGVGKESGGCWREGVIQVWIRNQLIYNAINISLPINFQTPPTYTFQFFKPH